MYKNKLLPLAESPIKVYQFIAYPLSVLFNYEECLPWFYSNYIQLMCLPRNGIDGFTFFGSWLFDKPWGHIPWFDYQIFAKDTFAKFTDKDALVRQLIDDGWYFYSFIDKFYIPNTFQYNKHHFEHDLLVYGYDSDYNFIALGYNDRHKLEIISITPTNLIMSLSTIKKDHPSLSNKNLIFFKKKENYCYKFDIESVYYMLSEYLYSKNTCSRARFLSVQDNNADLYVYGMGCYKCIIDYFDLLGKNQVGNDIRPLHLLWEHKKCMLLRLEYMFKNNYILREDSLYSSFQNVEKDILTLRNMQIKYVISSDKKILQRIVFLLKSAEDAERYAVELLLKLISKQIN